MKTEANMNPRPLYRMAVFVLILLLSPVTILADGITVSQSIDRTEMAFDDQARFEITLTWSGSSLAYFIEGPLRPQLDRLKVARSSSSVTSTGSGDNEKTIKTYTFYLAPTSSGLGRIESLEFSYISAIDSSTAILRTDPLEISIARPVAKATADDDGFSPAAIVIGLVVMLIAIFVVVVVLRRRKSSSAEPILTAEESLLRSLAALRSDSGSDHKKFQTGLYRLLVGYLDSRYSIGGLGRSCDEIVGELEETNLSALEKEKIAAWLKRADREKYSPTAVAPGDSLRVGSEVQQFFETIGKP